MHEAWGQPVVADNRAGANGVVAGEIVAKSPGDGYTLSMVAMGHAINPLIYKKLPYDGDNGLHADQPARDLPAARAGASLAAGRTRCRSSSRSRRSIAKPLTYASGGNGSSQHLAGALFAHMAGLNMTHVAYKGGNPAQLDLMAGNLDMMIIQPNSKELVTSGKLRALAVSSTAAQPPLSRRADRRRGGRAGLPVGRLVRPGRPEGHASRAAEEDQRRGDPRRRAPEARER